MTDRRDDELTAPGVTTDPSGLVRIQGETPVLMSAKTAFVMPPKTKVAARPGDGCEARAKTVDIRRATVDDIPALVDLSERALAHLTSWIAPIDRNYWWGEIYRMVAVNEECRVFVAVDGPLVVGWHVVALIRVFFAPSNRFVQTVSFWVDETHRSLGIEARLRDVAEDWARTTDARFLSVSAFESPDGRQSAEANAQAQEHERAGYARSQVDFAKLLRVEAGSDQGSS